MLSFRADQPPFGGHGEGVGVASGSGGAGEHLRPYNLLLALACEIFTTTMQLGVLVVLHETDKIQFVSITSLSSLLRCTAKLAKSKWEVVSRLTLRTRARRAG